MSERSALAGMGQRGPARRDALPLFGTDPAARAASVGEDPTEPLDSASPPARDDVELGPFPPPPDNSGALVAAAWPALCLLARLRAGAIARPNGLKAGCVATLRRFETEALQGGVAADLVFAGRYALCSAIDEQVLGTPWGDSSDWAASSLLSIFHNETWGGEKVFAIVDVAITAAGAQRDLTLLLYYVLSLGFQGRYRLRRDGTAEIEALRDRLYRALSPGLGTAPSQPGVAPMALPVSASRRGRGNRRRLRSWPPIWVVGAASALFCSLLFITYETLLRSRAERLAQALSAIDRPITLQNPANAPVPVAVPAAVTPPPPPVAAPPADDLIPSGFDAEGQPSATESPASRRGRTPTRAPSPVGQ